LTPELQKKLIDRLMASGQVEWVEPNVREPLAAPAVSTFNVRQWWLANWGRDNRAVPGVVSAWNRIISTNGSTSALSHTTVVAVLDTGMQFHVDLPASQFYPGYDFVADPNFAGDGDGWDPNASDPGDGVSDRDAARPEFVRAGCAASSGNSWHGAIVASFVAANGGSADTFSGVNPSAKILPVRVAGKCGAALADIVAGMYWAAGLSVPAYILDQERENARLGGYAPPVPPNAGSSTPAKVLNISFGGKDACGNAYQEAVNALRARGVSIVAAAGNEHAEVSRPGNCSGVMAVAALNRAGLKTTYSNFGSQVTVSTLGGDPGPKPELGYTDAGAWGSVLGDDGLLSIAPMPEVMNVVYESPHLAGTSYSAPIVSGVVSLMLDVDPDLTPAQVEAGLRASARPHVTSNQIASCSDQNPGRCTCTTGTCGAGVLDAYEAVRYALAMRSGQAYSRPAESSVRLDSDGAIADAILSAKSLAQQDRPANVPTPNNSNNAVAAVGGGGGGGALGWLELIALMGLMVLAERLNSRKQ
jgi:serine protease